jgi:hypothetical protein
MGIERVLAIGIAIRKSGQGKQPNFSKPTKPRK